MDRINGANWVDIGGGRHGFRDENLPAGITGTNVEDLWLNGIQEELMSVIEAAGLDGNAADNTLLLQALRWMQAGRSASSWTAVISMTTAAPPGGASIGDRYLVPTGGTGAWAGKDGMIAEWLGLTWSYTVPKDGQGISLPTGRIFERVAGVYVEKVALDAQSGKWNSADAGGTANDLTITLDPKPAALVFGMRITVKIEAPNTTAVTINTNGLGAVSAVLPDGGDIPPGMLVAGSLADFKFDGVKWRWVSVSRAATQAEMDAGVRSDVYASPATIRSKATVLFSGTSGAQSVPNNVSTALTNIVISENTLIDSTFAGGVLTVGAKDAGVWLISGLTGFSIPGSANVVNTEIWLNSTRVLVGAGATNASFTSFPAAVGFVRMAAGDKLSLHALQLSGGSAPVGQSLFSGTRLGN